MEKLAEGPLITPNAFKSEAEAIKYLKILLKGSHRNIRFFYGYKERAQSEYGVAMATALSVINPKKKENFNLILEVLKTRREYPEAIASAADVIKFAQDKRVIPLLRELLNHSHTRVRLETAGSLLVLGDADSALPVLEELAKEGNTYAIPYLFKSGWGKEWKLWDERGLEIIKRALDYPQDQIKAEAALFLAEMGIEKGRAEEVALTIVEKFKDKTKKNYGLNIDEVASRLTQAGNQFHDDGVACDYAMKASSVIKSKKAIPLLEQISERNVDSSYVCWKRPADEALKNILGDEKRGVK